MKRLGRLIALTLLVAGCGGGNGPSYSDAKAVARAANCTDFKTEGPEMFAADAGSCRHDGHFTGVQWFRSADNLSSWRKVASTFGGSDVYGANWVIECDTRPDCIAIQKKIGGTLE